MSKHRLSLACQPIPLSKIGGNQTAAGEGPRAGWRDEGGTRGSPHHPRPWGAHCGGARLGRPRASPSQSRLPHGARGCSFRQRVWGSLSHGVLKGPGWFRVSRFRRPVVPHRGCSPHSSASCSAPAGSVWSWPAGAAAGGRRAAGTGAGTFAAHLLPAPLPHPDARGGPSKAPAPRLSPLAMRSPRFLSLGPRLCFHNLLRAGSLAGTSKLDSPPETDPRRSDPRPRPRTAGSAWVSVKQAQTYRGVSGGSASDRCAPSRLE